MCRSGGNLWSQLLAFIIQIYTTNHRFVHKILLVSPCRLLPTRMNVIITIQWITFSNDWVSHVSRRTAGQGSYPGICTGHVSLPSGPELLWPACGLLNRVFRENIFKYVTTWPFSFTGEAKTKLYVARNSSLCAKSKPKERVPRAGTKSHIINTWEGIIGTQKNKLLYCAESEVLTALLMHSSVSWDIKKK